MQVNSAQDHLTRRKRQILAATYATSPPDKKNKTNALVTSIDANAASQRERFVAPFQGALGGASGGATFSSLCCLLFPRLTNLTRTAGSPQSIQTLNWSESGPVGSRTVVFTSGSGTVGTISANSVTLTGVSVGASTVVVTLFAPSGLSSPLSTGTININNPCFLGFVQLMTSLGAIAIENIKAGFKMLQPNGSYSHVKNVIVTTVGEYDDKNDTRLFSDESGKCVVTYWHRLSIAGGPEYRAVDHPDMHEVYRALPFKVYNLELENDSDVLMVHDTEIVAESYIIDNPANISITRENDTSRITILA